MERKLASAMRLVFSSIFFSVAPNIRRTITATASTADKLDFLLSLPVGATHVANYKNQNFVDVTNGATGGKGVDLIIDAVGQAHLKRNLDALAMDGRVTLLSLISGAFMRHIVTQAVQNLSLISRF